MNLQCGLIYIYMPNVLTWYFCLFFVLCDIWEDVAAWKILLRDVAVICLQFWEFTQTIRNREV